MGASMQRTARFIAAAVIVLSGLASAPARAHIGPGVEVELLGEPRAARAGVMFAGTIEISVARGGLLTGFALNAQGWDNATVQAPPNGFQVPPGGTVQVTFQAIPAIPDNPLTLSFLYDGDRIAKTFDLSQKSFERATRPLSTVETLGPLLKRNNKLEFSAPPVPPAPVDPSEWYDPLRDAPKSAPGEQPPSGSPNKDRQITVKGFFTYVRDPNGNTAANPVTLGAYGCTVKVYDDDTIGHKLLATTTTDEDGFYSVTFTWNNCFTCESDPDLYVLFRAENAYESVKDYTFPASVYEWETSTKHNFGGTTADFGSVTSADESLLPALHILRVITLTNNFTTYNGWSANGVTARWPDTDAPASHYVDDTERLYIRKVDHWDEQTIAHEFGHHWMNINAVSPDPAYCNNSTGGFCDPPPQQGGCTHCFFCDENTSVAWTEGWPDWLGFSMARQLGDDIGQPAIIILDLESQIPPTVNYLDSQTGLTCTATPNLCEGLTAALLNDIEDVANDNQTSTDGVQDELSLGADEILDTVGLDKPSSANGFISDFKARFPQYCADFFETALNNGFTTVDTTDPLLPTDVVSTDHTINVSSADPRISLTWTKPADNCSGIDGYSIEVSGGSGLPDQTIDLTNEADNPTWTSPILEPGSYVINIRTVDRAGNWSNSFVFAGPYIIRDPLPADITYATPNGWDFPLVPRDDTAAGTGDAHVSAQLRGDVDETYWSVARKNVGDTVNDVPFHSRVHVDGQPKPIADGNVNTNSLNPGITAMNFNHGPIKVMGGRHMLSVFHDFGNDLAEPEEGDNVWGKQYVWTPVLLGSGNSITREAPPDARGGLDDMPLTIFLQDNCDGVRIVASAGYNAAVVFAADNTEDYDASLFDVSTSPTSGFAADLAKSERGAGRLDAVIENHHLPTGSSWDIGIYNRHGGVGDYTITNVAATTFTYGTVLPVRMAADEMLVLREFYLQPPNLGYGSITLDGDPANGRLHVAFYDWSKNKFGLNDWTAKTNTDSLTGDAELEFNSPLGGWCLVAVWRNPNDLPAKAAQAAQALSFDLRVHHSLGDLVAGQSYVGWHSALVPLGNNTGTPGSVLLPPTLPGGALSTYINIAFTNAGNGSVAGASAYIARDDSVTQVIALPTCPPGSNVFVNNGAPIVVPGGRHTLTMELDGASTDEETSESNNLYSEQYVWSVATLALGAAVDRPAPPHPLAGWVDNGPVGDVSWFNCDGLRVLGGPGGWKGVAVLPRDGKDVDIRLHPDSGGSKNGFAEPLMVSAWGAGESDFLLVNERISAPMPEQIGVVGGPDAGDYRVEAVASVFRGNNPNGSFGPFILPADRTLQLHEVGLSPGAWRVELHSTAGGVDWGVALHPANLIYLSKSWVVDDGASWDNPAGQDEAFTVEVTEQGSYCISVWRVGAPPTGTPSPAGSYVLNIRPQGTDVAPLPVVTATALRTAYPNPFNPRTTIQFDIAHPGAVEVAVFNVRGERVRTLIAGAQDVGRHEVVWDGTDDSGRGVASGKFVVRLRAADGAVSTRGLMLVR